MNDTPEITRKASLHIAEIERREITHSTTDTRKGKAHSGKRPQTPEQPKKSLDQHIFEFFIKMFKRTR